MSVFGRREKKSLWSAARDLAWPTMGWRRVGRYWTLRLKRLEGSPYAIACGFACGAAVSFTPLIGLHFVLAAVLAWLFRGNIIASAIGTAIGNPWTFPFIWAGILWLGTKILGYESGKQIPADLSISVMFDHLDDIFLPMLIGGLPTAALVWVLFYFPLRRLIGNYQHHRRLRRLSRKQVLADERQAARDVENANGTAEDDAALEHAITIPEPGAATKGQDDAVPSNVTRLDTALDRKG